MSQYEAQEENNWQDLPTTTQTVHTATVNGKGQNNCKPDSFLTKISFQSDWDTAKKGTEPCVFGRHHFLFSTGLATRPLLLNRDYSHHEIQSVPRRWFKEHILTK